MLNRDEGFLFLLASSRKGVNLMPRLLEAGHYYLAKGPTEYSQVGWKILRALCLTNDRSLLFLDDIHEKSDVHAEEIDLPIVTGFTPIADHTVYESEVASEAFEVLEILCGLPKAKRARRNGEDRWFCSGFPITNPLGNPLCVLLDAGLTLRKMRLGFLEHVNILPYFYEEQQRHVLKLIAKALPTCSTRVVLYRLDGTCWDMQP